MLLHFFFFEVFARFNEYWFTCFFSFFFLLLLLLIFNCSYQVIWSIMQILYNWISGRLMRMHWSKLSVLLWRARYWLLLDPNGPAFLLPYTRYLGHLAWNFSPCCRYIPSPQLIGKLNVFSMTIVSNCEIQLYQLIDIIDVFSVNFSSFCKFIMEFHGTSNLIMYFPSSFLSCLFS